MKTFVELFKKLSIKAKAPIFQPGAFRINLNSQLNYFAIQILVLVTSFPLVAACQLALLNWCSSAGY
jgi:hypothetical protein